MSRARHAMPDVRCSHDRPFFIDFYSLMPHPGQIPVPGVRGERGPGFGSRRSYPDTFPPFEQFLRFKSPDKSGPTARATYLTYSGNTKRPQCTRKDPLSWASVRVSGQQVPSTESKLQWKAARKLGPGLCATLRFCSSLGPCTQPRIRRLYSSGLAWAVRCRFRSGW